MPPADTHRRTRYVIFNEIDEALFSLAISEAFPLVRFVPLKPCFSPNLDCRNSIADCDWWMQAIVPPEGWSPTWVKDDRLGRFEVANTVKRAFIYRRSYWYWGPADMANRWAWTPPTLEEGSIEFQYRRDDPEMKVFMRDVLRIVRRLSTNRGSGVYDKWQRRFAETSGGGLYWAGHQALTWCRGGDRRALMGALRPCIDWQPPDTPWHRALNARFEEWRQRWPDGRVPPFRNAPDD